MGETKSAEIIPFPGRPVPAIKTQAAFTPAATSAGDHIRLSHVLADLGAALEYQKEAIAAWRDRLAAVQVALSATPGARDPVHTNKLQMPCLPVPDLRTQVEALTRWADEVPDETAT